jgi:DNA-binding MarR family transcriptional regulator
MTNEDLMHDLLPGRNDAALALDLDLGPLRSSLGYMLRRAQMAATQEFHRTFESLDLRPSQFAVLTLIHRNPGLRQSQVSEALGIQRTNFVVLLDALEQRGLARRAPAADRRSHALHLTPEGTALVAEMARLAGEYEARLEAAIGPANRDQLLGLLEKLAELDEPG